MPEVVNIAAYRFVALTELPTLRRRLLEQCKAWNLRGTILLSPEGVNLFVAGGRSEIDSLLAELRSLPGMADFQPKISISDEQPFNRMLVRIKKEIIAFDVPGIEPAKRTSPKLSPRELRRWLDEGRPVTLLDTRNDYEVKLGTFDNAMTLGIDHFRDFPAAVDKLPPELKQQPVVMFCTGGIRCEKAGPYMEREGFEHIFQLDGGILKYFEEVGGEHYHGDCFVFDQRVGVDPSLAESDNTQCFNCLAPLTAAEQQDPRYVPDRSCPHCFVDDAERMKRTITSRHAAIALATNPLPGSTPYCNDRPLSISAKHDRRTLLDTLCDVFPHLDRWHWLDRFAAERILDEAFEPVSPGRIVRAGERYYHRIPAVTEPDVNSAVRILYEDDTMVVVNKPAPLPVHPSGRFNRNTLQAILNEVYHPHRLRPVHRLDANTTGVVVLARTRHIAHQLQKQFSAGSVDKLYLARVQGQPTENAFRCDAPIGMSPITLGGRAVDEQGQSAVTEFRLLQRFADGTSLVEARPLTGRTNQIRLHLAQLGWPIVGDQTYLSADQLGDTQTHSPGDAPLCLHALRIGFSHPQTNEPVTFDCAAPTWART